MKMPTLRGIWEIFFKPKPKKRIPFPHLVSTTYEPRITVCPEFTEYTVVVPQNFRSKFWQFVSYLNPAGYLPYVRAFYYSHFPSSTSDPERTPLLGSGASHLPTPPPTPVPPKRKLLRVPTHKFVTRVPLVVEQVDYTKTQVFRVSERNIFIIIFNNKARALRGQSIFEVHDTELDLESDGVFRMEHYWSWCGKRWKAILRFNKRAPGERVERPIRLYIPVNFDLVHCMESDLLDLEESRAQEAGGV